MPELYVLGAYEPQKRQGPPIWLRCVLAGRIEDLPDRCGLPPFFICSLLWAEMGHARLAQALEHLAILALESQNALASGDFADLARAYRQRGWKIDDAAVQALARVETAKDRQIISVILNSVYRPWLEDASLYLQKLTATSYPDCPALALAAGECILFVDGLRFDLAKRLAQLMRDAGLAVDETIAWNALPTVTPTGKPAASTCRHLINPGGSIEPVSDSVLLAEMAIEKGAISLLMPVS